MPEYARASGMKPKVTIGMCGRNCKNIVGFAIRSVAEQDSPHEQMEVIFVDDGSEDGTARIVRDYLSKTDISWRIFATKWQGLGKARNIVIHNAFGDYIVWVDSDEILTRDFVRKQIDTITQNPDVGILTGRMSILEDENPICVLDLIPLVVEYSQQDWKGEAKFPGTGGATYRIKAARQVGGFDETLNGLGEDIDVASRIRDAGWLILRGQGVFFESHGKLSSWGRLMRRSIEQGIQSRHLYSKSSKFFSIPRMNPFASAVAGCLYAVRGYKVTRKKIVLFLPFHFSIKMLMWFYGFCKG
jgi:glycosyltransferase involved in cell wall biosynthesis